jgi:membrane-associated protein
MEFLASMVDVFLHLDRYLADVIQQYGTLTYVILFLVIFCETGLVVTPFLPGDSLIFAAGTFAAIAASHLSVGLLFVILAIAAVLGDASNYWIGNKLGAKAGRGEIKLIKKEYLDKTHKFFEKYGGKTIFLARFVPIVRTFAPFVAGAGKMSYKYFLSYNLFGGIFWVALFLGLGYFFGNIKFVKDNFELVIIVIILISVLPAVIEWLRHKKSSKTAI